VGGDSRHLFARQGREHMLRAGGQRSKGSREHPVSHGHLGSVLTLSTSVSASESPERGIPE
jgi:hypothetical protein